MAKFKVSIEQDGTCVDQKEYEGGGMVLQLTPDDIPLKEDTQVDIIIKVKSNGNITTNLVHKANIFCMKE